MVLMQPASNDYVLLSSRSVEPALASRKKEYHGAHRRAPEEKRELRVLQVFSALGMGGAETWLMALLRYFHENGDDLPFRVRTDICLTGGTEALFDREARLLGARLFYLPYTRRTLLNFICKFRKILSNGRYDAIHDHQDYAAGWHFLFGWGRLPSVRIAHVHNPFFCVTTHNANPVRRITLSTGKRLLSSRATHITGTSKESLTRYGFDDPSFRHVCLGVANCGFDVSRFQGSYQRNYQDICREFGWNVSVKILLFVGRLNTTFGDNLNQKNPAFALEVARASIARDPNIRMLIAGGGDDVRSQLEQRVRSWGLGETIRLIGVRRDIPRLMLGSNLLLFPSLEEGLGMVAVEAQASGLRVLAADLVPHECVVVPEMVRFLSLTASLSEWANEALRLMCLPKPDPLMCNKSVRDSAFSIENSARKLVGIYSGAIVALD